MKFTKWGGALLVCSVLLISGAARAATAAWSASGCGKEPSAPSIDVSSIDRYNKSVDRVTTYEKEARAYNKCVMAEAHKQETEISNEARAKIKHIHEGSMAVHSRIAANFTRISAQMKAGQKKLGGKAR